MSDAIDFSMLDCSPPGQVIDNFGTVYGSVHEAKKRTGLPLKTIRAQLKLTITRPVFGYFFQHRT